MKTLLSLQNICVAYQHQKIVENINFNLVEGEISCLLGPSGCGKTTALRAIAGLEPIYNGQIKLRDEVVSRPGFTRPPEKRQLAMVFQDYALFPHMDVTSNVSFGVRNVLKNNQGKMADETRESVGLSIMGHRYSPALVCG